MRCANSLVSSCSLDSFLPGSCQLRLTFPSPFLALDLCPRAYPPCFDPSAHAHAALLDPSATPTPTPTPALTRTLALLSPAIAPALL
ncbi:hypothetical protein B0H17DRAFT_1206335 [Mycena rosella]|uniref:Uncharacterized protein n=1 Tax=Mycena rosella TaxID=1033263 RepID=A0AAD7D586_MYCRO|nr:hypothetical protein B0H17DRAFT_1206335 [Mycena rosella]